MTIRDQIMADIAAAKQSADVTGSRPVARLADAAAMLLKLTDELAFRLERLERGGRR